jgi:hypothetical protein
VIAAAAFALLFWQTRAGPASQLLGVVGCAALTATLLPRLWNAKNSLVVVLGSSALVLAASGGAAPLVLSFMPEKGGKQTEAQRLNNAPIACARPCGRCGRWRSSPRAWCSPSSTSARG